MCTKCPSAFLSGIKMCSRASTVSFLSVAFDLCEHQNQYMSAMENSNCSNMSDSNQMAGANGGMEHVLERLQCLEKRVDRMDGNVQGQMLWSNLASEFVGMPARRSFQRLILP